MQIFNPFDSAYQDDPFPVLTGMRNGCPIAEIQAGLHIAVQYADVSHVIRSCKVYSSAGGLTLSTDMPADKVTINGMDGPEHMVVRRMLQAVLRVATYKSESEWIAAQARELVADIDADHADLMTDLANKLPARVILKLIGVSDEDYAQVRQWTREIEDATDPANGIFMGDLYGGKIHHPAVDSFANYIQKLIDERRAGLKADDLVARVVAYRDEDTGHTFSDAQIISQLAFLLIAGNHTTANLIGSMTAYLATDPEVFARVRADRSLVEPLIEETLRFQSPVQALMRTVTEDVELHGKPLRKGQKLLIHLQSANRDDSVFDDPDTFDIGRAHLDKHLAFGYGTHFCIGAPLARLEGHHTLNALLDRFVSMRPQPGTQPKITTRSGVNRGPSSVPVILETA